MDNILDPSPILEVGFGFWSSKVLLSAVKLEVFTKLGDRFGDFEVNLLEDNSLESRKGKLKEVIDSRGKEHLLSCCTFNTVL
ncbi:MAG: hypothetical protein QNJ34_09265 [Xenococcaceae cyanobacterium MO_188.B29]|nr:hypothetical protein [Xenococcaceae cyanobacterium MO_188.B29]